MNPLLKQLALKKNIMVTNKLQTQRQKEETAFFNLCNESEQVEEEDDHSDILNILAKQKKTILQSNFKENPLEKFQENLFEDNFIKKKLKTQLNSQILPQIKDSLNQLQVEEENKVRSSSNNEKQSTNLNFKQNLSNIQMLQNKALSNFYQKNEGQECLKTINDNNKFCNHNNNNDRDLMTEDELQVLAVIKIENNEEEESISQANENKEELFSSLKSRNQQLNQERIQQQNDDEQEDVDFNNSGGKSDDDDLEFIQKMTSQISYQNKNQRANNIDFRSKTNINPFIQLQSSKFKSKLPQNFIKQDQLTPSNSNEQKNHLLNNNNNSNSIQQENGNDNEGISKVLPQFNESSIYKPEEYIEMANMGRNEVDMSIFDAIMEINQSRSDSDDKENYQCTKQRQDVQFKKKPSFFQTPIAINNNLPEIKEEQNEQDLEKLVTKQGPLNNNISKFPQKEKISERKWQDVMDKMDIDEQNQSQMISKIQMKSMQIRSNSLIFSFENKGESIFTKQKQQQHIPIGDKNVQNIQTNYGFDDEEEDNLCRNFENNYYDLLQEELNKKEKRHNEKNGKRKPFSDFKQNTLPKMFGQNRDGYPKSNQEEDEFSCSNGTYKNNQTFNQYQNDKSSDLKKKGMIPEIIPYKIGGFLHKRKKQMKQSVEECKVWHYFLEKLYHISSYQFEQQLVDGILPQELKDYNIRQINRGNFNNKKLPRLIVVVIEFQILHQVVKAVLLVSLHLFDQVHPFLLFYCIKDFSGSVIGSFPKSLFMDDKGDNENAVAIKKEEGEEDDQNEDPSIQQENLNLRNDGFLQNSNKQQKPLDYKTVYTINHEKGTQISLKPNTLLVLKDVITIIFGTNSAQHLFYFKISIIQQNEEAPFLSISERNIMQIVYPF